MTRIHALVLVAALALVAAACGGGSGSDPTTTTLATTTTAAPGTTQATTTTAGGTGTTTAPAGGVQELTVIAAGGVYQQTELQATVGEIEVTFTDNDTGSDEPHNIHFQIGDGHYFTPINTSAPTTETVTFTVDQPGTYNFWCDTHPDTFKGVLIVEP